MEPRSPRVNMVDNQLRPNHVSDGRVQQRFVSVAREDFVSPAARGLAYLDTPAPQGEPAAGREVFAPMVAARLVQALNVQPDERVTVLAGGSGYTAAVLAGLAGRVQVFEDDAALLGQARVLLAASPHLTVQAGAPAAPPLPPASCAAVLLDAPAGQLPPAVLGLLAEGGRLAAVRANEAGVLEGVLVTRRGRTYFTEVLFETKGTILPALAAPAAFVF